MNEPDQTQELVVVNLADSVMAGLTITGPAWIRRRVFDLLNDTRRSHAAIMFHRTIPQPPTGDTDEFERRTN